MFVCIYVCTKTAVELLDIQAQRITLSTGFHSETNTCFISLCQCGRAVVRQRIDTMAPIRAGLKTCGVNGTGQMHTGCPRLTGGALRQPKILPVRLFTSAAFKCVWGGGGEIGRAHV